MTVAYLCVALSFLALAIRDTNAGQASRPPFCSVPAEGGTCRASLRRWFFNEKTGKCERFVYGGCGGNKNNFRSKDECTEACRRKCPSLQCLYFMKCAYGQQTDENGCPICSCINSPPCKHVKCKPYQKCVIRRAECFRTSCPTKCVDLDPTGPCYKALLALPRPIPIGAFVPTCVYTGYYALQQTWGSTGESWCVTREGKEIAGTRTSPGQPPYDCNKAICKMPKVPGPCDGYHRRYWFNATSAKCVMFIYGGCGGNRNNFKSAWECTTICPGNCPPLKCDPNCLYGVRMMLNEDGCRICKCHDPCEDVKCKADEKCEVRRKHCEHPPCGVVGICVKDLDPIGPCCNALQALPRPIPVGTFVPTCDYDGYYAPQQTWGSTGESWCVTREGKEIAGTRTSPGQPPFDCNKVLGLHPSGPCFKALLALPRPIPVGTFVPTCEYDGYYSHQQTWGSTGESWCVTREGNEIARTRTKPGQPPFDCNKVSDLDPTGPCTKALHALPRPIPVGTFVPTCEDDGYYSPQQTWGSTGESWCVTREGKEIAGTRTKPWQPPFDCNKVAMGVCRLPARRGPCSPPKMRWYYDKRRNVCRRFRRRGCGRTGNRFATRRACEASCKPCAWNQ